MAKSSSRTSVGTCSLRRTTGDRSQSDWLCSASEVLSGKTIINISGCPPHPDWIVGTLAHILLYKDLPKLDKFGRPVMFYGGIIHDNCPRRQFFDNGIFAANFSDPGCLLEIGCRGPYAHCDATYRQWNSGVNSCIRCGGPCIGCTEPSFPDGPVYARLPEFSLGPQTKSVRILWNMVPLPDRNWRSPDWQWQRTHPASMKRKRVTSNEK